MTSPLSHSRLGKLVEHSPPLQRHKLVDDQLGRVLDRATRAAGGVAVLEQMRAFFGAGARSLTEWLPLLAANPELLVRFLNSGSHGGQRTGNGPCFELRRAETGRHAGVFHIESLNPFHNDTLLLVASAGRFLRNATLLGYRTDAERPVLITGVSWARRNKSVRSGALSPAQAADGLERNLAARRAFYELSGLAPTVCNVGEEPAGPGQRAVSEATVAEHVTRLAALVQAFWPALHDRPLGAEDKALLLDAPFSASRGPLRARLPGGGHDLLELFPELRQVLPSAFGAHLTALQNIAVHLGRLSEDTFHYFLAQMYFQGPELRHHLKLAAISERRFDDPMHAIRPHDCALDALYLPHYRLGRTRLLPYSTEHIDLSGLAAAEVAERIFTLRECDQAQAQARLEQLLARTPRQEVMRLFSDLLSYYQLALRQRGQRLPEVERALTGLDPALVAGLDATDQPEALRGHALEWIAGAFLSHRDDRHLPPFLRPFFWPASNGQGASDPAELAAISQVLLALGAQVAEHTGL